MSGAIAATPCVLHTIPGRMRIHLPEWSGQGKLALEEHIGQMQGIYKIQTNSLTKNALVLFDPTITDEQAILQHVQTLDLESDLYSTSST